MYKKYILFDGSFFYTDKEETQHMTENFSEAKKFKRLKKSYEVYEQLQGDFDIFLYNEDTESLCKVGKQTIKNLVNPNPGKHKRKSFGQETRLRILNKNNCRCFICGEELKENKFTIDHWKPLSKHGTNDESNLVPVCSRCNGLKAAYLENEFYDFLGNMIMCQMQRKIDSRYKQNCMRKWLHDMATM